MYASSSAAAAWPTLRSTAEMAKAAKMATAATSGPRLRARRIQSSGGVAAGSPAGRWPRRRSRVKRCFARARARDPRRDRPGRWIVSKRTITRYSLRRRAAAAPAPLPPTDASRVRPYADAPRLPDAERVDLRSLVIGDWVELEIGPGRGWFLIERAEAEPRAALVGLEIRRKWAAIVDARMARRGLSPRARVFAEDVRDALPRIAPDGFHPAHLREFPRSVVEETPPEASGPARRVSRSDRAVARTGGRVLRSDRRRGARAGVRRRSSVTTRDSRPPGTYLARRASPTTRTSREVRASGAPSPTAFRYTGCAGPERCGDARGEGCGWRSRTRSGQSNRRRRAPRRSWVLPVSGAQTTVCVPAGKRIPATGVGPRAAPSMVTLHQPPCALTLSFPVPAVAAAAAGVPEAGPGCAARGAAWSAGFDPSARDRVTSRCLRSSATPRNESDCDA